MKSRHEGSPAPWSLNQPWGIAHRDAHPGALTGLLKDSLHLPLSRRPVVSSQYGKNGQGIYNKANEYGTHTRANATWAVRRKKRPRKSWRESLCWATKWGLQSIPSILRLVKSSWSQLQVCLDLDPDHWLTLVTHTAIHQGSCQICSFPIRKPIVRVMDACVNLTRSKQAAGTAKTLEPLLWALIRAGELTRWPHV